MAVRAHSLPQSIQHLSTFNVHIHTEYTASVLRRSAAREACTRTLLIFINQARHFLSRDEQVHRASAGPAEGLVRERWQEVAFSARLQQRHVYQHRQNVIKKHSGKLTEHRFAWHGGVRIPWTKIEP